VECKYLHETLSIHPVAWHKIFIAAGLTVRQLYCTKIVSEPFNQSPKLPNESSGCATDILIAVIAKYVLFPNFFD